MGDGNRPRIVVLCGSTRFVDTFNEWRQRLTYDGKIVLSIEIVTTQARNEDPQPRKARLDELHKRKIDLADEVLVLNVGGYVGKSTRSEIAYALALGKPIRWLEPPACCNGSGLSDYAAVPCEAPQCPVPAPAVLLAAAGADRLDAEMAAAVARQRAHVVESHQLARTGWTRQQWVDDARRLMGDLDGSVLDLVNGHVLALLAELDAARDRIELLTTEEAP